MRKRTPTNTSEGIKNIIANQLRDDEERLNVRDFTDFIFDPTDPIDVGIAGLAATGVGLPAAAIAKVGNTGRKIGKGVASLLPEARDNAIKNYFKYYLGRELYEAPELIEEVSKMREGGLAQALVKRQEGSPEEGEESKFNMGRLIKDIRILLNPTLLLDPRKPTKEEAEKAVEDIKNLVPEAVKERYTKTVPTEKEIKPPVTLAGNVDDDNDGDNDFGRDEANRRLGILNDPAFQRALIAGGAAMMKPTEGLGRSFLGLGEFGEAFSDSLSKSEAQKSDVERLHEIRVRAAEAEGTKIPSFEETYALVLNQSGAQDASELNNTFIAAETLLQKTTNIKDPKIEDFEVDGEKLASVLAKTDGSAAAVADAVAKAVYTPKEEEPGLGSRISNFFSGD